MPSSLDRRTSRSVREARAYRTVQAGLVSGAGFVVTLVLWIAGAIGAFLPVILLILTVLSVVGFRSITGSNRR